jgi:hypothetical protein
MAIKINGTSVIDDNRNISSVGVATIGSGNSTTTIDGNTGVVNVGTGVTIDGISGNISIAGTFSASGFNLPLSLLSLNPLNNAINVVAEPIIDLFFNLPVGIGTTGTVVFREGSPDGVGVNTLTVSAASTVSDYQIRFTYSGSPLSLETTYYPVFSPELITSYSGQFLGINTASGPSYSFTTLYFDFITPADGATNVGVDTNITLTFTSTPPKGTGTIQLRQGSTSGTLIESFNVSTSSSITVSGNNFIINPTNILGYSTSIHTIIPSTAIPGYAGLNTTGAASHSFTTRDIAEGDSFGGGTIICQSSGTRWIVAPNTSEVSRTWYCRNDANTRAQQVSGCTGWFVPTCGQLQNPGFTCRTYWDSYSPSLYWSSTELNTYFACFVNMDTGNACSSGIGKAFSLGVRAFRCVTY